MKFILDEQEFRSVIRDEIRAGLQNFSPSILPPEKKLLTRREAARYLLISLPVLDELTNSGLVRGYRIGARGKRYRQLDLDEALQEIKTLKNSKKHK